MTIRRIDAGPRLSRAVVHGDRVFLAGLTADDLTGDVQDQTRQTLAKIDHYLASTGSDRSKLLQATIWLPDIADYDAMNEVWDAWVDPKNAPARACIESRLAGEAYRVEIMIVAAL